MSKVNGVGNFVRGLILKGELSNSEILDKVKEKFVGCETTMACVAWYKSDMRKKGIIEKKEVVKKMSVEEYKKFLLSELDKVEGVVRVEE